MRWGLRWRFSAHAERATGGAGFVCYLAGALRLLNRCFHKSREKRVGMVGLGLELGVVLDADHERVVLDLDDLDEPGLGVGAANEQAGRFQARPVGVVVLETVAVAFLDQIAAIGGAGPAPRGQGAVVRAQAHRTALGHDAFLGLHEVNHWVLGLGRELGRMGVREPEHVARELDDGDLHAEAEAVIGHLPLAGEPGGNDLALDAQVRVLVQPDLHP